MISICELYEGKAMRYAGAGLTGLGGAWTGGHLVGAYQGKQKSQYGKQIARQNNDAEAEMAHQSAMPARAVGKSLLGAIPVVGAAANIDNQKELEQQKEKIMKNAGKKTG